MRWFQIAACNRLIMLAIGLWSASLLHVAAVVGPAPAAQLPGEPCPQAAHMPVWVCKGLAWLLAIRAGQHMLGSDFDAAYADLSAAIRLNGDHPALYVLRGQVQLARYEWDASAADYAAALAIDDSYADAYFYRGILRYSILQTGLRLRDDALADFERYLDLAPDGARAAEAARYVALIRAEMEALNGD